MIGKLRELRGRYTLYSRITGLSSISRRYFVIGAFDGVLTILGLIVGAYLSGKANNHLVFTAGVATAIALGISSGFGAFEAEECENITLLSRKQRAMLSMMKNSVTEKAHRFSIYIATAVHGFAPIPAAIIPLIPFRSGMPYVEAMKISFAISFALLFIIGFFLGRISGRNVLIAGMRMLVAGVATLLIIVLLEHMGTY